MQGIAQFERLKKRMRTAIDKWSGTQRAKFRVVERRFQSHIDKDLDQEVMDNVILDLRPVNEQGGMSTALVVSYPISVIHLGDDLEQWGHKLDLKVPHILKTIRHRWNISQDEGRQNLPGA